ncbi:MAG: CDP-diacylglycerol--serine O-phosphatidyltransferase [Acidobacteriota bacterium]
MSYLPSVVTMGNLVFGSLSLVMLFHKDYRLAAVFILVAMVMDVLDGRVARALKVSSEFGKELDSLADLVSFGVAPALLVLQLQKTAGHLKGSMEMIMVLLALIFIICGAYRLARFNILNIKEYYVGVPITVAGMMVALIVLVAPGMAFWIYMLILALLSFLMVSKITVPKP